MKKTRSKSQPPKEITETISLGAALPVRSGDGVTSGVQVGSGLGAETGAAPRQTTVQADPTKEYAAGGFYNWSRSYLRTLPFFVDDVTKDFGDDLYDRMMTDPQVLSVCRLRKLGILANNLTLTCAKSEGEDGYDQAVEIQKFVQDVLDGLKTPLRQVLFSLLDGLDYGNKIAELIYDLPETGPFAGKMILVDVKPKPRHSLAFAVDAYTNVVGLLALIPGQAAIVQTDLVIGDPGKTSNLLPRKKFAVLTNRPKDGDPRGQADLRPAYNSWNLKQQVWLPYFKYLQQFGTPSIYAVLPENAQDNVELNADGSDKLDDNGNPVTVYATDAVLKTLQDFQGGSAAAFAHDTVLDKIESEGTGEAFLSAIDLHNREIAKAILCQTLATEEGKHQARAAADTHADSLSMVYNDGRSRAEDVVNLDLIAPLVTYNYPGSQDLAPKAVLSDTEGKAFAAYASAVAALMTSGYFAPSQMPSVDQFLGLKPRTEEEAAQAATNPAPLPAADPASPADPTNHPAQTPKQAQTPKPDAKGKNT